ncbi:MAG: DegT/DnrJ/EryC1/StrS family aminotransferase [Nanoarchaeota archaeon]|nr:DegT/DnrJ/EryC1/StrS family aminotransferase [Nanoarchaeota archaeon]
MIKKKQTFNENYIENKFFFPNGRTAFFHSMKIFGLNKDKGILLPNYIGINQEEGSGVLDPIKKCKVGFDFYKLNKDLSINYKDLERKIRNKNISAVLVIHYFGFCQNNMNKIVDLCKKYKKYLVEDCAHAFNSYHKNRKLGTYGDCSFYSIHKFLAIDQGGILLINNPCLITNLNVNLKKNLKDDISKETLLLLNKSKLNKISEKRIKNFNHVFKMIKSVKGMYSFYNKLPLGIVPLNFPIIIKHKDRNSVYFKLLKHKIETVSLYHTLVPELNPKDNKLAFELSSKILNLPIHEDLSKKDLKLMVSKLNKILSN